MMIAKINFKKYVALLVCIIFICTMFFASHFCQNNLTHTCTDSETCPVCQMITECESIINAIEKIVIFIVFYEVIDNFIKVIKSTYYKVNRSCLISEKIKLVI